MYQRKRIRLSAIMAAAVFTVLTACGSGLAYAGNAETGQTDGGSPGEAGKVIVRVHGDGEVKLTDPAGGAVGSGDREISAEIPDRSYIRLDADAAGQEGITVNVTDENGFELEPEERADAQTYVKEITAYGVTKYIDVTFGKEAKKSTARAAARTSADARFPEAGDRFSGEFSVHDVDVGSDYRVDGVTVGSFTGILESEETAYIDCCQPGADTPVVGLKYNYTYTVLSVDKASGTVKGSIFSRAQDKAAVGLPGEEGYQKGYQALAGIVIIHREYNGRLVLKKISADPGMTDGNGCYSLEGARYGVYRDASCTDRAAVLVSGADGISGEAELLAGRYYVKEIDASAGYALDSTVYKADITAGQTTKLTVEEQPQSAPAELVLEKLDEETGEPAPQGAAALENAEFTVNYYAGFYDADPAEQGISPAASWVLKTDGDGRAGLDESMKVSGDPFYKNSSGENVFPLGTVTVRETKAPEGYLLNSTVFVRKITSDGTAETVNTFQKAEVPEKVIRGDLEIVKFREDRDDATGQRPPLEGIIFELTSKTTGDTVEITTDENGYASTEQLGNGRGGLAFDSYRVHEKNTPEGLVQVSDFEITISREGQKLYYILEDNIAVSPVRLVKTDSTTGKKIPASGVRFRLLDEEKKPVSMTTYYPDKVTHEFFETDGQGMFILPDRLPAGVYYFREVRAPEGYLLAREDVRFEIGENHDWDEPLEVEFPDRPVMGKIRIVKTETGTGKLLQGAEFTVTAAEDIVTPDGTVRAEAGDLVDTVVSDQRGEAQTKELFPGKYMIRETACPTGYARAGGDREVELCYKDQYTAVVLEEVCIENDATRIVSTTVRNAADGSREADAGPVEAVDVVSLENLQPGASYTLRGVLVDQRTGELLEPAGGTEGASVISEVQFTAEAAEMDVEVRFAFDASELEGWTIAVFEYLYQDGIEISSHEDLEDELQQLRIRTSDIAESVGEAPRTGDLFEIPRAAAAAAAAGTAGFAGAFAAVWRRFRKKHFTLS